MRLLLLASFTLVLCSPAPATENGDPALGRQIYRACAACHSLEPDRNMTGPSLAGLWGRRAGSLASFTRYSPALKATGFAWDEATLDAWIADPAHYVPGNRMTFPGIEDSNIRADLIAYLKQATMAGHSAADSARPGAEGMDGMRMGTAPAPNLKKLDPAESVLSISHCRDSYEVATGDGNTHAFWERNLRFKTDSSPEGPEKGAPAILGAGMMGDRASVIFAAPEEISALIKSQC